MVSGYYGRLLWQPRVSSRASISHSVGEGEENPERSRGAEPPPLSSHPHLSGSSRSAAQVSVMETGLHGDVHHSVRGLWAKPYRVCQRERLSGCVLVTVSFTGTAGAGRGHHYTC